MVITTIKESSYILSIVGLIEHVTVLIGISIRGHPVAGVIHQPFYQPKEKGRTIWGVQGIGAFGYEKSTHDGLVIVTTRSHSSDINTASIEALNPTKILKAGGSGYKALLVLLGEADAYIYASKGTKRWDTCAPEAVLCAAGGSMTDILGRPINYQYNMDYMNYVGLIATLENHDMFVQKIPTHVKEAMSKNA